MIEQCGSTELHDPHDACAGLSEYDLIVAVKCPDCEAPRGQGCRFGTVSGADSDTTIDAEDIPATAVHAGRRDLAFTERGTCRICGLLLLRRDGRVWHPEVITTSCPPMPDPGKDWNGYALAVQKGMVAQEPGVDAFVPEDEQPIHLAEVAHTIAANLQEREPGNVGPILLGGQLTCPECLAGKHQNCDGRALNPYNDQIEACECSHEVQP